ncbi:MAG: phenylalanine--tRNA ligase beta subunit-related protein [Nitrososphaerota archaeon]
MMINIKLTQELKIKYPKSIFGSMFIMNVPNTKMHEALEKKKHEIEKEIREMNINNDNIIALYNSYFNKWNKVYPVENQIKNIKKGYSFPKISILVDSMFIAELKNRILTSGHDLNEIKGSLTFDISKGGEKYIMLNGKEQELEKDDIILKDEEGILASVLFGPAKRTSITLNTKNVLYLAWCPYEIDDKIVISHLNDISSNLKIVFNYVISKIQIHK